MTAIQPTTRIDAIVPARNEVTTVAAVVKACLDGAYTRQVIVVDDGSTDGTGEVAAAAGAKVLRLDTEALGSKGRAMEAGVDSTDAEAILFVDADCTGLRAEHLDDICRPFVEGRATMSVGWFDYGWLNWAVLRFPPTTGERVIPRWVWDAVAPGKRVGYSVEVMINEVIAEGRLPTVARIMAGVGHRTKRHKLGWRRGFREQWRMFWHLIGLPTCGVVRWRTYWFYLRDLRIEGERKQPVTRRGGPRP